MTFFLADFYQRVLLSFFGVCIASNSSAVRSEGLLAFPEAEGFASHVTGGRYGEILFVTNLNDSGPGSLREAIEKRGARTILFRVAGNIRLSSPLKIRHGNLTIAGQSAPGDGICLQAYGISISQADNVIIRYLRIRPGDVSGIEQDALSAREASNVMIDHCSMSWSVDECVSLYGNTRNITVQWCLISESLYRSVHQKGAHGYGGIWGGKNASWHHNLLAHHSSRNPRIVGKSEPEQRVDVRNNVIYNWGFNSTYGGDGDVQVNLVGNFYKPGPATKASVRTRIANPSEGSVQNNWWIEQNVMWNSPKITDDNWLGVFPVKNVNADQLRASEPFPVVSTKTQSADEAYESVLKQVGAMRPVRDSIDNRIVQEVREGKARFGKSFESGGNGIIDSQRDVGGWPELKQGELELDSDFDGLPDFWETRYQFDPSNATDAQRDKDGDGYTQLEEWLNGTDPNVYRDYTVNP